MPMHEKTCMHIKNARNSFHPFALCKGNEISPNRQDAGRIFVSFRPYNKFTVAHFLFY